MKFYLKKTDGVKDERVFLYATYASTSIRVATKIKVKPKNWNQKLGESSIVEEQAILNNWRAKIENTILDRIRLDKEITGNTAKALISAVVSENPIMEEMTISYLFKEYMKEIDLAWSTKKNYRAALGHYEQFLLLSKATDIVKRYTVKDFKMFVTYLKDRGFADNSVKLYTKCIKKVLNKAYWDGLIENEVTRVMKFTAKSAVREDFVIFTTKELLNLEDITLTTYARKRLDVFLFLCYSGMRFSDYKRVVFEPELCEITADSMIVTESVKTGKRLFIPNAGHCKGAWRILNRYQGKLPQYKSIDTFNRQIRIDFQKLEHPEYHKLTSHCARKSFATALLMEQGVAPLVVSKLLSHSDIKTTLKYYEKSGDDHVVKALEKTEQESTKHINPFLRVV